MALEPRAARDFELRSMSKEGMFEKKLKWLETDRPTNGRKIKIKLHILFMIINIMKLTFTSFCPNYTSDMVLFFNHQRHREHAVLSLYIIISYLEKFEKRRQPKITRRKE